MAWRRHDLHKPPETVCFHFQRGRCQFGTKCKYSHDRQSNVRPNHPTPTHATPSRRNEEDPNSNKLKEWKRLLRPNPGYGRSHLDNGDKFFPIALQLMDGDVGASQEIIKLLAQEEGLHFIRNLAERQIPQAKTNDAIRRTWLNHVQPLFELITHRRVIDSAVLEQEVAAIYNYIRGVGGQRMMLIFDFVAQVLGKWATLPLPITEQDSPTVAVGLSLVVLAKLLDSITTNMVDEGFHNILKQMKRFVDTTGDAEDNFAKLSAQRSLQYIERRLGVGDALALAGSEVHAPVDRAEFVLRRDLPGKLSQQGARHDNDHSDIRAISILPTREEILSPRGEFLPINDPTTFHIPGIGGRLDREFRLLREDTIGQLRDAVRAQLETSQEVGGMNKPRDKNTMRTYTYGNANVQDITFDRLQGLDFLVKFQQPQLGRSREQRNDWWAHSKRLQPGGLVCVISDDGSVLFCIVAESTLIDVDKKQRLADANDNAAQAEKPSLAADPQLAFVRLHLAEVSNRDILQCLRWYKNIGHRHRRVLVEFPGVLLPSFKYTLEALQQMSRTPDVPFTQLIAPDQQDTTVVDVPPPHYATKAGFSFDLSCLTNGSQTLYHSNRQPLDPEVLSQHSRLDVTQSAAVVAALSRCLAIIQGPPGTGKSYTGERIIQALLANAEKVKLGPILCVCYTNHALDQLLEHLYKSGMKQIVRIGSRSKSAVLEDCNLRLVSRGAERTKSEKRSIGALEGLLTSHANDVTQGLHQLSRCDSQESLETYLRVNHARYHQELFGTDKEGFQTVVRRPNQIVSQWLQGGQSHGEVSRPLPELYERRLFELTRAERHIIYNSWLRKIRNSIISDIADDCLEHNNDKLSRNKVARDVDLRCIADAKIVGVTTTGLARNLDLLRKARCKVMVCEEAGEVLEAHTLTALLPSVEHAILIGDHQQLRPQIQNYDLQSTNPRGSQYSLDVSMFERLVAPNSHSPSLPFSTLETQRRMHPSISELIRSTLYPALEDGGPVNTYPDISGMKKRLFWLHHEVLEDGANQSDPNSTSHVNSFEIEMTIALVQHLVRQGPYGPDDIAVITPYLGQLLRLRRRMENMFEISVGERDLEDLETLEADTQSGKTTGNTVPRPSVSKTTLLKSVRLATVDNFQGEEAKVVVVSLVRSNEQNKCGFLNTFNRINVLLSRAQHGMYLIGNANTYSPVPMWDKVIAILKKNENFGTQLELQCPRHPETPLLVSQPDHFLIFSPEGGCRLQCDRRLPCGHSCINRCHSDGLHNAVKCLEDCLRLKQGCDHPCPLRCGDECHRKCIQPLQGLDLVLDCGHKVTSAPCWQAQDPHSIQCRKEVDKIVPGCNHKVSVPCHVDVESSNYTCRSSCYASLDCGHTCRSKCWECNRKKEEGKPVEVNHGICKQSCGRKYTTCPHACRDACHGDRKCGLCSVPCEVRCSHSKCSKACHEPCAPCAEKSCASHCPHTQCTMPCAAPCDWVPCSKRCDKMLDCGHQCPSLCGEQCPNIRYCQACGSEDIKVTMVDFILGLTYQEIDLDQDPCLFPDCGHFITKASMDALMDMTAHYETSPDGDPTAISSSSEPFSMDEVKVCPTCRGSLRNIARYGRIVRRAMLDEATKKFISWSNAEYFSLAERLADVQQQLSELPVPRALQQTSRPGKLVKSTGRLKQLTTVRDWVATERYRPILKLWHRIQDFIHQVRKEEQPFQRVSDFVLHSSKRLQKSQDFTFDETLIQVKGELQAKALWLRCETIVFADFMKIRKDLLSARPKIKLDVSKQIQDCEALIEAAKATMHWRQQVEGHVYYAHFCALTLALSQAPDTDESPAADQVEVDPAVGNLKEQAVGHLAAARELVQRYPSVEAMKPEIEAAEVMLRDGVFYAPVSAEEMRAVYQAMAAEFSGTGHWYTCVNGHPFTVGECGMPMEEARCPECGGVVGGLNHRNAEGVRRAGEIEDIARGVQDLAL